MNRSPRPSARPSRRLLAVALSVFALGAGLTTNAFAADEPKVLVGMGDSFTSGAGNLPYLNPSASNGCNRSAAAYVNDAAKALKATPVNIACSGAAAINLNESFKTEPAQLESLRVLQEEMGVDYVAITVGGNDLIDFSTVLSDFVSDPSGGINQAALERAYVALQGTYLAIHDAAPNAEIFVLGYPNVMPADQNAWNLCVGDTVLRGISVANLNTAWNTFNNLIKEAAEVVDVDGKVHFVPVRSFAGHGFCSADSWVIGINGTVSSATGALHPNEKGHEAMAKVLAGAIAAVEAGNTTSGGVTSSSTTSSSTTSSSTTSSTTTSSTTSSTSTTTSSTTSTTSTTVPATTSSTTPTPGLIAIAGSTTTQVTRAPLTPLTASPTTAAPQVLGTQITRTGSESLAVTGSSVTGQAALGLLLMGVGLLLMWLRLVHNDRLAM